MCLRYEYFWANMKRRLKMLHVPKRRCLFTCLRGRSFQKTKDLWCRNVYNFVISSYVGSVSVISAS